MTKPRLSISMRRALENLVAGREPYCHISGMAAAGGATGTTAALYRHGYIERCAGKMTLTEAGRNALKPKGVA